MHLLNHPSSMRLRDWLDAERANGLIDVKIFRAHVATDPIEIIDEFNRMMAAPVLPSQPLD